ncbi:MAG: hypothetical protein ACYDC2_01280 [Solirubrobacteraceae bacterium]
MRRPARRNLLLAVAAAAVIAAVVVALTASGGGAGHNRRATGTSRSTQAAGDLAIAARYLGITRAQLRHRLRGATLAQVADATPGHTQAGLEGALLAARSAEWKRNGVPTAEQSARAKRLRERVGRAVLRPIAVSDLAVAAKYLAVPEASVRDQLLGGRSLASLARSHAGTSRAGLIAAILAARTKRLEAAQAAHLISAKVEHVAVAGLPARIAREVVRTLGQH